jgi:signal transduction histidine kinase
MHLRELALPAVRERGRGQGGGRLRRANGEIIDVEIGLWTIDTPERDKTRIGIIQRNVTERKQAESVRMDLVSTASCELRTPLTSIVGAIGLLKEDITSRSWADARDIIDVAYRYSERMMRLVDDLLDIEKIESGEKGPRSATD